MKHQPLVSIILPVYNAEPFLSQCLDSLINQTYPHIEIIAVNDGSTDNSLQILKSYSQKDSRIKVFSNNKNRGIGYTTNFAIKKTSSPYIARMDADDIAYKNRISRQINFLFKNPQTIAVGGQCRIINTKSELVGKKTFPTQNKDIYHMMYTAMSIQQPTAMFNTKLLPKNFSWYNNSLSPVDDLDLFFRLFQYGQLANLPSFVLKYRQYHTSASLKNPKQTFKLTQKVRHLAVKKYHYQPTLAQKSIAFTQFLVVSLLPSPFIYPAYSFLRGITPLKANFRNDSFNIFKLISSFNPLSPVYSLVSQN